ncbi:MAG: hypothetical protein PUK21_06370 [Peptostreptococcaceae bacterium]|nr:hypothetical protein [Peptostreptococcaceae bacterium]MDY5739243.1 hypothetical protein [Anaerovoracaceae bacterium]
MSISESNFNLVQKIKKIVRLSPDTAKLKKEILLYEDNAEKALEIREYSQDGLVITRAVSLNDKELEKLIAHAKERLENNQKSNLELIQEMDSEPIEETIERLL